MPATPDRRMFLTAAAALLAVPFLPATARAAGPVMQVAKDPNCGCCADWVAIMEEAGFSVTVDEMDPGDLRRHKMALGVPAEMASCHTAVVDGYVIEGHVPADDIRRLLAERPDAVGLTVPGMPYGSPGMGPESEREAYAVHLILKGGGTEVFANYAAA